MRRLFCALALVLGACATTVDPSDLENDVHIWARTAIAFQAVSRFPCELELMIDGHLLHIHGIRIGCIEQSIQVLHKKQLETF